MDTAGARTDQGRWWSIRRCLGRHAQVTAAPALLVPGVELRSDFAGLCGGAPAAEPPMARGLTWLSVEWASGLPWMRTTPAPRTSWSEPSLRADGADEGAGKDPELSHRTRELWFRALLLYYFIILAYYYTAILYLYTILRAQVPSNGLGSLWLGRALCCEG